MLYIAEHYREPLTSAGVAAEFGCTPAQLNYELRKISGRDFQQSLDRIRINIATGAMFFEDVSLSYLLSYSGFSTEASFYRVFKSSRAYLQTNTALCACARARATTAWSTAEQSSPH